MYLLYGLFFLMIASSIGMLAIPVIKSRTISSRYFMMCALFITVFSLGLYEFANNHTGLSQWLAYGKKHYEIQQEVSELGGFDGIIRQIKKKLEANPDDAQGWYILGKLYLANHEYDEARAALGKAAHLRPDDQEIAHFNAIALQAR